MSRAGGPVIPNHGVSAIASRGNAHQFNALAGRQPDDGAQSRSWEAQGKRSERIKGGTAPRSTLAGGPSMRPANRAPRDGSNGLVRPAGPPRGHSAVRPSFLAQTHITKPAGKMASSAALVERKRILRPALSQNRGARKVWTTDAMLDWSLQCPPLRRMFSRGC